MGNEVLEIAQHEHASVGVVVSHIFEDEGAQVAIELQRGQVFVDLILQFRRELFKVHCVLTIGAVQSVCVVPFANQTRSGHRTHTETRGRWYR